MITRLDNKDFIVMNASKVRVTTQGNIVNVKHLTFTNENCPIKKIDKDHYQIIKTGEIREYTHIDNRSQSINSLRQTFARLREVINTNVSNPNKCLWVTLTYAQPNGEPMTDPDTLYKDFDSFRKRLYRYCKNHNIGKPEYIVVREPQGSGAWHCHCIFIFPTTQHYIPNDDMARLWGHGFTSTKALKSQFGKDIDNVGAYLTAYLGDIPLEDVLNNHWGINQDTEIKTAEVYNEKLNKRETKYFVKGARLQFYPRHFKLYNHSKGIFEPLKEDMTFLEAKKKVRGATLTYSSHQLIESSDYRNVITNYYFNTTRENNQVIFNHDLIDTETGEILERKWL